MKNVEYTFPTAATQNYFMYEADKMVGRKDHEVHHSLLWHIEQDEQKLKGTYDGQQATHGSRDWF